MNHFNRTKTGLNISTAKYLHQKLQLIKIFQLQPTIKIVIFDTAFLVYTKSSTE